MEGQAERNDILNPDEIKTPETVSPKPTEPSQTIYAEGTPQRFVQDRLKEVRKFFKAIQEMRETGRVWPPDLPD